METPSASQLMEDLNKLEMDDGLPPEIEAYDPTSDESKKKVGQAFGGIRTTLKTAKGYIVELQEKNAALEQQAEQTPAPIVDAPGGGMTPEAASALVMNRLQLQAMQHTGLTDLNNPLLVLEVNRLYALEANAVQQRSDAQASAGSVIDETLSGFSQLKDEDLAAVKERLGGLDVLDQVKPEVIKREANTYIGENIAKFSKVEATPKAENAGGVTSGAAAASFVKRGSGVEVGEGAGAGTGEPSEIKPAKPEEIKRMKAIGADPTDPSRVQSFRNAEAKVASRQ